MGCVRERDGAEHQQDTAFPCCSLIIFLSPSISSFSVPCYFLKRCGWPVIWKAISMLCVRKELEIRKADGKIDLRTHYVLAGIVVLLPRILARSTTYYVPWSE